MTHRKVGILNFQYSTHNYGAVLQASALEYVIKREFNIPTEHIDFVPVPVNETSRLRQFIVRALKQLGVTNPNKRPDIANEQVFECFRKDFITRSAATLSDKSAFSGQYRGYSHVVVGSDQVWRTSYTKQNADLFFLPFSRGPIKISYAASFGVDLWEESKYFKNSEFIEWLNDFDHVSVREAAGVDICSQSLMYTKAVHVLDPTLLAGLDFFESILQHYELAGKPESLTPTVAYYKLDVDRSFSDAAESLASKLNTQAENFYYKPNGNGYEYFSVPEWLDKVKSSQVVLTDSYHCICLAILFKKEFVCVSNASRGVSRLESLLGMVGLEERLVSSPDNIESALKNPIDYVCVEKKLEALRVESKRYLHDALNV